MTVLTHPNVAHLPPEALQGWSTHQGKNLTTGDPTMVAVLRWCAALGASQGGTFHIDDVWQRHSPSDVLRLHGYFPHELAAGCIDLRLHGILGWLLQNTHHPFAWVERIEDTSRYQVSARGREFLARVGGQRSHLPARPSKGRTVASKSV